jgi:hypothetical protein
MTRSPSHTRLSMEGEDDELKGLLSPSSSSVPPTIGGFLKEERASSDSDEEDDFDLRELELDDLESQQPSSSSHPFVAQCALYWRALTAVLHRVYKDNVGILFIVGSNFVFSLVNLFVKLLSQLEEPVPALEVCLLMG